MNDFLRRTVNVAVLALVAVVLLVSGSIANAAEPKLDDDWHFTLVPYLWLPSVGGKMNIKVPNAPTPFGSGGIAAADSFSSASQDFNIGKSSYLSNLSFAALVAMELEKGDWSLFTDIMYISFSDDNRQVTFPNLPGGSLDVKAETGIKGWLVEGGPAYSLYRSQSVKVDFLAGVRYWGMDTHATLDISSALLPNGLTSNTFSYNKGLVDPIVGLKGKFELGKGWFIPYYFDGGGFGINHEWSWQAFGGVGYHFSELFSMNLGYRYLQYNFSNNNLLKDVSLSGGLLGFIFRF